MTETNAVTKTVLEQSVRDQSERDETVPGQTVMDQSLSNNDEAQRRRMHALITPREHGAWGLLLVPLVTGAAVGIASKRTFGPLVLFTVAALSLFWLRTPVESLLGTTPLCAQTTEERKTALIASIALAGSSAACLAALLWNRRNRELLLLGGLAALAFVVQGVLKKLGRRMRMTAQLVGTIGLTCTSPAAYYLVTGQLDRRAMALWAANWMFAGNQIHFVQLRIHAARAATFAEKFARGRLFFVARLLMLPVVGAAGGFKWTPALTVVAFVPAFIRGVYWFLRGSEVLQVKKLGWSELRQGILFAILLAGAFVLA
jgi:hypothetical protein